MTNLGGKKSQYKATSTHTLKLELAQAEKKMTHDPQYLALFLKEITSRAAKARDGDSVCFLA